MYNYCGAHMPQQNLLSMAKLSERMNNCTMKRDLPVSFGDKVVNSHPVEDAV